MKKIGLLFSFLFLGIVSFGLFNSNEIELKDREITLNKSEVELDSLLEEFDDYSKELDGSIFTVSMTDIVNIEQGNSIVNFSDVKLTDDQLNDIDDLEFTYDFIFNVENCTMQVTVTTTVDGISETEYFNGVVFVNQYEEVDAIFDINGEFYYLSEFDDVLINFGWLSKLIKAAVATVVAVVISVVVSFAAPIALVAVALYATCNLLEDACAVINYNNNKSQTPITDYVYGQGSLNNWKFGLSTMDTNGCGIVATYNTLKYFNKSNADLVGVTFDFDYRSGSLALGLFGADPTHVGEYLRLSGLSATPVLSYDSMEEKLEVGNIAIVLQVNYGDILRGAHYYIIEKLEDGSYNYYNYGNDDISARTTYSFTEFSEGGHPLIYGYIVK